MDVDRVEYLLLRKLEMFDRARVLGSGVAVGRRHFSVLPSLHFSTMIFAFCLFIVPLVSCMDRAEYVSRISHI